MLDTSSWPIPDYPRKTRTEGTFRAVAINDPHLSIHNPPAYKVDYWDVLKTSLRTVFKFAITNKCDAIIWAGDIFNLKSAHRNPLHFIAECMQLMNEHGLPNLGIAGNHDIKFGHIEQGLIGQPLEILWRAGCYRLLDEQEWLFDAGDHTVRIAGASYRHGHGTTAKEKTKKGATHLVTVGHYWFGPQSGSFFGEPIVGPDLLGQGETDLYVIGHHHEDQGVLEFGGKKYASVGSVTRTGGHANDLSRRPAALFIETSAEGIQTKILRPKVPDPETIMDLDRRKQILAERKEMQVFIESLHNTNLEAADPRAMVEAAEVDQETKDRVLSYLERAEGENT